MLSRRNLIYVIIGGLFSGVISLILASPLTTTYDLDYIFISVNTASMIFATGLFFFLTAGLLFCSRSSHLYLLRMIRDDGLRKTLLTRTLHVLVITSLFTVLFAVVVFLYPVISLALNHRPITFDHFVVFPAVLGASLVGSFFLALLASSLAVFIDDTRLCVVLGCVSTLLIAFLSGWNTQPIAHYPYSLTRNLAYLSPHNFIRALAITLASYQFESANRMVQLIGFAFTAESLVVPLLLLSSISIVLLIVVQRVLMKNSSRWTPLQSIPLEEEIWSAKETPEMIQKTTRIRRSLRIQRVLTVLMIAALLVSTSAIVSIYTTYVSNTTRVIHYVNPGDSESISLGLWNVYDLEVQPPFPGLFNSLFMSCSIEGWGNASDSLSFFFGFLAMNSTEFDSLDEESRLAILPGYILNHTWDGEWGFGISENIEESHGSYICVLWTIADADPIENSYIEASLLIIQEGA